MSVLDEVEQLALGEALVVDDQLVNVVLAQHARQRVESAEHGQAGRLTIRRDRAKKLVANSTTAVPEHVTELSQPVAFADQHGTPSHAGEAEHVPRQHLVARPQQADEQRSENERRRRQPVGREVVAGAEPERERDHRDEDQRCDDLTEPRANLAPLAQAPDPEHEHGDHRQERSQSVSVSQDFPERRPVAEVELAQHERQVDPKTSPARSSTTSVTMSRAAARRQGALHA